MFLASLPKSYDVLVTTLEGRPEEELTLEYVNGKLLDDWRRRTDGEESGEMAFRTATGGKPKFREAKKRVCHYCQEEGHFTVSCCKVRKLNRRRRVITASIWLLRRIQENLVSELE